MSRSQVDREDSCWKARYSKCDGEERSSDLMFVSLRSHFKRNPAQVVQVLQRGWDVLCQATGINPVAAFGQRVVVGFRHPSDDGGKDCDPGWGLQEGKDYGFPGERWPFINIPWGYLSQQDQPEEACSHEFVHPFVQVRPLKDNAKEWVEGLCDFLRLPLLHEMGLVAVARIKDATYRAAAWQPGADYYHDHAGRLLRYCDRRGHDLSVPAQLATAVGEIWQADLSDDLVKPYSWSKA